jgi:plastocyanin
VSTRILVSSALAAAVAIILVACGSSNNPASSSGGGSTCTASTTTTTITIANGAVCPQNITVPRGTQVTFINQDNTAHEMNSDPHPEHTDCVELNQVGHLEVGQSRQSGNLNIARRCGFHDHLRNEVAALRGSITIQ